MLTHVGSWLRRQDGDTLIEVTVALAILSMVMLSSTVVVTAAFRTGQTARERTQVSEAAQEQLEALRTFRDNHTWTEFQAGSLGFSGINTVATGFHMELLNTGTGNEWVPVGGPLTPSTPGSWNTLAVPTSNITISTSTGPLDQNCGYVFLVQYSFLPIGLTNPATNQIQTTLTNYQYPGGGQCP